MARNRKRAKERRVRQAQPVASGRGRERRLLDGDAAESGNGTPDPIEHAAPDAELAEIQLATARGARGVETVIEPSAEEAPEASEPEEVLEEEFEPVEAMEEGGRPGPPLPPAPAGPLEPAAGGGAAPAVSRRWLGARLLAFLEGSWRELQRVQWPDRRQVMQATGVVIGFVIVASIFLGLADLVASKVVSFILKGHF